MDAQAAAGDFKMLAQAAAAIEYGGQGAEGFVLTPTVGWSWRRKDSLGLRIEGGVFYNLYEERSADRLIPGSAEPHRSYGFELWVGTWI